MDPTHEYLKSQANIPPRIPDGVSQQWDGFYYRDGVRYCEDCWEPIPKYVDFPLGLTSPESDGDRTGNFAKYRMVNMAATAYERQVREPLRKAVCLDCYNEAFQRFYPGAILPELSRQVRITTQYEQPLPAAPPPLEYIEEPKM